MIESILGWVVLGLALCVTCAIPLEVMLFVARRVHPGAKLHIRTRAAIVCVGAIGLWFVIPVIVHAVLGRPAH